METKVKPLVSLIENLIATEPHEAHGFKWAARPDAYYCKALGIAVKTLGRWKKEPPIQRKRVLLDHKSLTLLRIGDPDFKDAAEYARTLRGVWIKKTGMVLPKDDEGKARWERMKNCLWGYVLDVMALPEVQAFTDQPGELAVAAFKHALDNWQFTAGFIKLAAEAVPDYVPRFWYYPNIPTMRRFYKTVVYVYAMALQAQTKFPDPDDIPGNLATAARLNQLAAILDATDEAANHPGNVQTVEEITLELEKMQLAADAHAAIAAAAANDKPAPELTPEQSAAIKSWSFKEPWKPIPFKTAAE